MKVSRKVGRRKHSRSSSISRRRLRNKKSKSGYKKRYGKTQRGGARSRKYGHKRGKRFHRGGVNEFNCDEFNKTFKKFGTRAFNLTHDDDDCFYNNDQDYKKHQFELTFKKIDPFSFTEATEMFALKVNLYIKDYHVEIVLERVTGSSPQPSFKFEGVHAIEKFEKPTTWNNIKEHEGSRKYNFNLGSNVNTFTKIVECVRNLEMNLLTLPITE